MSMDVIFEYLTALEKNNNREWYHANKTLGKAAQGAFEEWIGKLLPRIQEFDPSIPLLEARDLTFKLVRDTRFSHDKSPYNPAFRAHIAPRGKLPIPVGYYIMLRPGNRSFLGGGMFADMFREATTMVRDHIASHGEQWQSICADPAFAQRFTVGGAALKRVPQGYDPDCPQAEYLKYKSWYLEYPVADATAQGPDFLSFAAETFGAMKPFNHFLNQALADFQMPARP